MKVSAAVALLLATDNARAVHTRAQKPSKALTKLTSDTNCDPDTTDCQRQLVQTKASAVLESITPVPSGYDMGANPQWAVVKNYDGAPDGYYLPDMAFLQAN